MARAPPARPSGPNLHKQPQALFARRSSNRNQYVTHNKNGNNRSLEMNAKQFNCSDLMVPVPEVIKSDSAFVDPFLFNDLVFLQDLRVSGSVIINNE